MRVKYGGKPFIVKATLQEMVRGYLIYLSEQCELDEDCEADSATIRGVSIGVHDSGIFQDLDKVDVSINCSTAE